MNNKQGALRFAGMLAGACLATASLPVGAGLEQDCRQEAEDYGIAPEQLDDYIVPLTSRWPDDETQAHKARIPAGSGL